jgi:hypothetical protein
MGSCNHSSTLCPTEEKMEAWRVVCPSALQSRRAQSLSLLLPCAPQTGFQIFPVPG